MCLLLLRFVESERRIEQLLHKRHAVELDELDVLLHPAIEGEAHLPGAREHLRVFDSGFVNEVLRPDGSVASIHMEAVAVGISSTDDPGRVGDALSITHWCIACTV